MHDSAKLFTMFAKQILPDYFTNRVVLDVGSGDINGNNRFLFENCEYNGNDVIEAKNVTIVSILCKQLLWRVRKEGEPFVCNW